MKRIFTVLLLLLFLSGCSGSDVKEFEYMLDDGMDVLVKYDTSEGLDIKDERFGGWSLIDVDGSNIASLSFMSKQSATSSIRYNNAERIGDDYIYYDMMNGDYMYLKSVEGSEYWACIACDVDQETTVLAASFLSVEVVE